MPNWYTTLITAKGSEADLERIVSTHVVPSEDEDRTFDMNTIIPVPEAIKDTAQYRSYYGLPGSDRAALSWDAWEQSDWYKWVEANWSGETWTKDLHVKREHGILTLCFITRWSPPEPVLHRLREMYPTVDFEFRGFDHVNCYDYDPVTGEYTSREMDVIT